MLETTASSTYPAEVLALIAEARKTATASDLSLKIVNDLLIKVGCDTQKLSSSYRYGDIAHLFTAPAAQHRDLVCDALATVSDVYGVRYTKSSKQMAILLYAMSVDENWRTVLTPGHDSHAFARNILTYLVDPRGGTWGQDAVMQTASTWLRPGDTPFIKPDASDGRRRLQRDIASEMFGDHWWFFNSPEEGRKFDVDLIVKLRPAFLPGLGLSPMDELTTILPELG
jgi:hypothetical protein